MNRVCCKSTLDLSKEGRVYQLLFVWSHNWEIEDISN